MRMQHIEPNTLAGNSSAAAPKATISATLAGSDRCEAAGITVTGATPVLKLCRSLIAAGLDPDRALHVFRGAKLALRIRSLREGARLTVKEPDRQGTGPPPRPLRPMAWPSFLSGAAAARNSGSALREGWTDWPQVMDGVVS